MGKTVVHNPARQSNLGVDELYYEIELDDWPGSAESLQSRQWHMLRKLTSIYHQQQAA